MSAPLAFISYDYSQNEADRVRFVTEAATCSQPFKVEHWSVKGMAPREDWQKMVHHRIGRCDVLIVLVGSEMDEAQIAGEIQEARKCNVPFLGVYVDGVEPRSELPAGLTANHTIPWDWKRIASAIRQIGNEGKHHVFA